MATSVTLKPNAIDISGSTSGTTTLQASAVAGTTTLTLPAATDTLVGKATTDTLTNKTLTGAAMNGTLGATTPSTASVTTLTTSSTVTHSGGTANGVAYLDGSKALTTGSALVFDGTNLGVGESTPTAKLHIGVASAAVNGTKGVRITNPAGTIVMLECGNGGDSFVGTTSGSDFNIRTNNVTRATFDNSGNLLVGTTSYGSYNTVRLTLCADPAGAKWAVGPTTGSYNSFYISTSGSTGVYLANTSATSWSSVSDERFKTDFQPIENAIEKVCSLRALTGRYKEDATNTRKAFLIAQDVLAVLPEAVDTANTEKYGLAYTDTIPLLVAAIKEQQAIIQSLTARITALEGA